MRFTRKTITYIFHESDTFHIYFIIHDYLNLIYIIFLISLPNKIGEKD